MEILSENKLQRIARPKQSKRRPSFYTQEELNQLFREVEGESIEAPVKLCATYGLRRSEVLGLTWRVVDFNTNTITISHTVVRFGTEVLCDDMVKADASFRTLPLTESIKEYLLKLKERQDTMQQLMGNCYNPNDYICTWDDGRPLAPDYLTRRFGVFLKNKGLRHIRFHDLRHSSASLLVNNGFMLEEVMKWLGHANIRSTERYAHLQKHDKEDMANVADGLLSL